MSEFEQRLTELEKNIEILNGQIDAQFDLIKQQSQLMDSVIKALEDLNKN